MKRVIFILTVLLISISFTAISQPPPPPEGGSNTSGNKLNGGGAPIGGGAFILIGMAAAYGIVNICFYSIF